MAIKQGLSQRALRVSEQVQRELAQMIATEVRDPRVKGVTVTQVEVTSDLSHALVRYVHPLGYAGQVDADAGFKSVNGFLRHGIAARLTIFKAPLLHFEYDKTFEEGMRLSALIDSAREDDARVIAVDDKPVIVVDDKPVIEADDQPDTRVSVNPA
ncbi:MAG: 30S ribosome-binding factor RbfA [Casimicrobium sp.]